jgi:hypothetical protein
MEELEAGYDTFLGTGYRRFWMAVSAATTPTRRRVDRHPTAALVRIVGGV